MTEDKIRLDFAVKVLHRYVTSSDTRLRYGQLQRRDMKDDIENGVKPTGYRAEWLVSTTDALLDVLIEASRQFNASYHFDMISTNDMRDVLIGLLDQIDSKTKKS
jgi:hypothetical protein